MKYDSFFHEIYGVYYQTVAKIINKILDNGGEIDLREINAIIEETAYNETSFFLIQNIQTGLYADSGLLRKTTSGKYSTSIKNNTKSNLTNLEKQWLKLISLDPRIKLFNCDFTFLNDIEPLYDIKDVHFCGQYSEGDLYDSPEYVEIFKTILKAIKEQRTLHIKYLSVLGKLIEEDVYPTKLIYSFKEDMFRVKGLGTEHSFIFNLSNICTCEISNKNIQHREENVEYEELHVKLSNQAQAVERFLLYFSSYDRRSTLDDDGYWHVYIKYPITDEAEILPQLLSFVPYIKIIAPQKIKEKFLDRLRNELKIFITNDGIGKEPTMT